MFASASRAFIRRAPFAIAAAGGVTSVMSSQSLPRQFVQCEEATVSMRKSKSTKLPRTTSGLNAKKPTVIDMKTGLKFLDLFKAEYLNQETHELDMSKQLTFNETAILFEGAGGKKKQVKEMFEVMDADHSGHVSFAKIIAYFLNHAEGNHTEKMKFLFHACDVDFSSRVEPHELKVVVHHMMSMKMVADGKLSFFDWHPVLYADIPERYVLHLKSNELVTDIFTNAHGHHGHEVTEKEELTEKEFIAWHARGGKQAKRLDNLFNIDHMSHH